MSTLPPTGAPPAAPPSPRPVASGALVSQPLPRLLHQLVRKRVTGRMVIVDETGIESAVYLRDGAPVHVVRPTDIDRLDHVVAEAGLVDLVILREVSATLPPGKRLGEVLIERGLVAAATLGNLLKLQMRRKLFRLFHIRRGQFSIFTEAHAFGAGSEFREMRVDPRCLVFEGIRSAYDEARLRAELAPLDGRRFRIVKAVPASLLEAMGFPAGDATVALLSSAPRTLADLAVAAAGSADALAVVLALLYADLLEAQAAAKAPVEEAASPPAASPPSTPAPGSAAAPDAALVAKVEDWLGRLDAMSHFEVLGVPQTASTADVGAAFLRAMREFHPDRIAGRGLHDLAAKAARLVARINEANAVLSDAKQRAAYVAARATGIGAGNPADIARAVLGAEAHFHNGEQLLRKGDFVRARDAFQQAVQANPQEPSYRAYAAWARFAGAGADKDRIVRETLAVMGDVLAVHEHFALARHWQGLLHKHLGDLNAAETAFRAAVADDRSLLDAERELRVLEMRRTRAATMAAANPPEKAAAASAARPRTGLTGKFLKR